MWSQNTMPFIEIENGSLYYAVSGKGRPLVLIHGAWASNQWWRWQVPALSRNYLVLSIDVRGHGQSSPLEKVYSVDGFTRDLQIFLQKTGIDEAVLFGWSMGGIISMQYCLNYPTKVKGLVLIATRGHRNPSMKLRFLRQYFQSLLDLMIDLNSPRKYNRSANRFPGPDKNWLEGEIRNMFSPTAPKEALDWVMADLANNPRENYFKVAKSLWNWSAGKELRRINAPTLIMVGEKDVFTPPRFSRLLHAEIPNSRLIIVENASHYLMLERPDLVNAEIIKFLKSLDY